MRSAKRQPRIMGTKAERSAKSFITAFLSLLFILFLSIVYFPHKDDRFLRAEYALFLTAGLEILAVAIFSKRIPQIYKSLPMFQFTFIAITHALQFRPALTSWKNFLSIVSSIVFSILLIRTAIGMKRAAAEKDVREQYISLVDARLPMLSFILIDMMRSPIMLLMDYAPKQLLLGFITRVLFLAAAIQAATPDCVLVNVRRIARLLLMFLIAAACSSGLISVLAYIQVISFSLGELLGFSCLLAADILIIGGIMRHPRQVFLRSISQETYGCSDSPDDMRREFMLNSALKHNYSREYARRWINMTFSVAEIAAIQQELKDLRSERLSLKNQFGNGNSARLTSIEKRAIHLLSILSHRYRLHTGF